MVGHPLFGDLDIVGVEFGGELKEALDVVLGFRFLDLLCKLPRYWNLIQVHFLVEAVRVAQWMLRGRFEERLRDHLSHAFREVDPSSYLVTHPSELRTWTHLLSLLLSLAVHFLLVDLHRPLVLSTYFTSYLARFLKMILSEIVKRLPLISIFVNLIALPF